jgi:hypothetical protein
VNLNLKNYKAMMNQEQLLGLIRHILTIIGTILITKGSVDESSWALITGSTLSLAAVLWSVFAKSPTVINYLKKK